MSERNFTLVRIGEQAFELEVMIFGDRLSNLQPLVIFHSIEFPVPPSPTFCKTMWDNGLQVIFVRRAGFGRSSPLPRALVSRETIQSGATAMAEAVMMRRLFTTLGLSDIILLAMGSSNLVAYRLTKIAPEISYTVFANPVFNQDIFQVFTPDWFRAMLRQIVTSQSGLQVAVQGMKLLIRRDPVAFYKHIYQKNPYDLLYIENNRQDYLDAGEFALDTDPAQLFYDAIMLLGHDDLLNDGFFANTPGSIFIGKGSLRYWRVEMQKEADRLGLPIISAPKGDLFCAYVSTETLLKTIRERVTTRSIAPA